MHRIAGTILLANGADTSDVELRFQQAIETARGQGAKSFELRATLGLVHLRIGQGRKAEALELLTSVYDWFTEGFETADLREARTMLASLDA